MQKEFAIDDLVSRMADVMRAGMEARKAGKQDLEKTLNNEHRVLARELRALELGDIENFYPRQTESSSKEEPSKNNTNKIKDKEYHCVLRGFEDIQISTVHDYS